MATVITGLQKREPRSNQSGNYTDYDMTYQVDRLTISPVGDEGLRVYFRSARNPSLGVGLLIPRGLSSIIANIVEAVDHGAGTIGIDLE